MPGGLRPLPLPVEGEPEELPHRGDAGGAPIGQGPQQPRSRRPPYRSRRRPAPHRRTAGLRPRPAAHRRRRPAPGSPPSGSACVADPRLGHRLRRLPANRCGLRMLVPLLRLPRRWRTLLASLVLAAPRPSCPGRRRLRCRSRAPCRAATEPQPLRLVSGLRGRGGRAHLPAAVPAPGTRRSPRGGGFVNGEIRRRPTLPGALPKYHRRWRA